VLLDINLFTSQLAAADANDVLADVLLSQVGHAPRSHAAAVTSSTCRGLGSGAFHGLLLVNQLPTPAATVICGAAVLTA
jgi:hypothetical protein